MISAISPVSQNNSHKPTFTSVLPVKVRIDGREVYSEKNVRPAVLQLTAILAGPIKNNEKFLAIAKKFGLVDPDFHLTQAISGYPVLYGEKKVQPSNYFRFISKKHNYLFTGEQAKNLRELGKTVGLERHAAKLRGDKDSLDLQIAQGKYYSAINQYIRSQILRVSESYNFNTREKEGAPVDLVIDMISNKKYGEKGFKMELNDISFTKSS